MTDPPLTPDALATWTDEELVAEWKRSSWQADDPKANALAAEIERRKLDL